LAQQATEAKSNEITAIPKVLEMLELKGCILHSARLVKPLPK
jgi:predicted transposase YbfD/YdcC